MSTEEPSLEQLLQTAISGHTPTPWLPLHQHLLSLLSQHSTPPTSPFSDALTDPESTLLQHLTSALQSFVRSPPHTIQRLAELLHEPRKYYTQRIKWLRALERVLSVESGVDVFPLEGGGLGGTAGVGATLGVNGLGSDESLGGALLTRIPWLKEGEGEGKEDGAAGLGVVDVGPQPAGEATQENGQGVEEKPDEEMGGQEEEKTDEKVEEKTDGSGEGDKMEVEEVGKIEEREKAEEKGKVEEGDKMEEDTVPKEEMEAEEVPKVRGTEKKEETQKNEEEGETKDADGDIQV